MGSGHTSLLARGCVRQPGSSVQTPRLEDFNGSFISWARSVTLTHLPGPPLSGGWGGAERSTLRSRLGLSSDQPCPGAHPELPHWNIRCSCHLGNSRGFGSSVSGTGVQGQRVAEASVCISCCLASPSLQARLISSLLSRGRF